MTRGKKAVSKSSGGGLSEVRKSIRFESGASGESAGVGGEHLQPVHEDVEEATQEQEAVREEIDPPVSVS